MDVNKVEESKLKVVKITDAKDLRKNIILLEKVMLSLLMVLMCIGSSFAMDCDRHPIYCQISKNAPHLPKERVLELSNIIHKVTKKHSIPVRVFVGILAQESAYKLEAKGCHKGLIKDAEYGPSPAEPVEIRICSDFGIGQIYYKTARGFGFDVHRLTRDLEYSIEAAAIVLADFQRRYSAREIDWWTRYNAKSDIKRKIYKKLVERYF